MKDRREMGSEEIFEALCRHLAVHLSHTHTLMSMMSVPVTDMERDWLGGRQLILDCGYDPDALVPENARLHFVPDHAIRH